MPPMKHFDLSIMDDVIAVDFKTYTRPELDEDAQRWYLVYRTLDCPVHGSRHGLFMPVSWSVSEDEQPTAEIVTSFVNAKIEILRLSIPNLIANHEDLGAETDEA